jgi:hypothetical protein
LRNRWLKNKWKQKKRLTIKRPLKEIMPLTSKKPIAAGGA